MMGSPQSSTDISIRKKPRAILMTNSSHAMSIQSWRLLMHFKIMREEVSGVAKERRAIDIDEDKEQEVGEWEQQEQKKQKEKEEQKGSLITPLSPFSFLLSLFLSPSLHSVLSDCFGFMVHVTRVLDSAVR